LNPVFAGSAGSQAAEGAGILLHVKWPTLLEMELAQSALRENARSHSSAQPHQQN